MVCSDEEDEEEDEDDEDEFGTMREIAHDDAEDVRVSAKPNEQ